MKFHRLALAGAVGLASLGLVERQAAALTVTSGLVYHLDSTSGVQVTESSVSGWLDQSGNGRDFTQANPLKQPIFIPSSAAFNNLPVIRFDGNETGAGGNPVVAPNADELILNSATSNQTVFIVNRVNGATGGLEGIWGVNNGDVGFRRQNGAAWAHPSNGGDFTNTGAMRINGQVTAGVGIGQAHILAGTRSAALGMAATSIGDYFQVGANAARSFQGDVAEVIVYDRLLSTAEIKSVERELATKYAINIDRVNVTQGGKTATQSTNFNGTFVAGLAIDNNFTNFSHTATGQSSSSWQVDLGATIPVEQIVLSNRGDGCCPERMRDLTVDVLDFNGNVVQTFTGINAGNSLGSPGAITLDLPEAALGRTVRVTRQTAGDPDNILSLGEVQVMSTNLALNGTATQSSEYGGFPASNAIDGDLGNFTHTASGDANASLTLDLGQRAVIDSVILHNRDSCCGERLRDIQVDILGEDGVTVLATTLLNSGPTPGNFPFLAADMHALFGSAIEGQFIRVSRLALPGGGDANNVLSLGELQVFGTLAIPEPATALLGAMGLGLLALRRKRVA